MEKEFELTLNLLKEEKNLYFEKIKTLSSIEEKEKIINSITNLDNQIFNIYNKLEALKKANKKDKNEENNKVKEPNKEKNEENNKVKEPNKEKNEENNKVKEPNKEKKDITINKSFKLTDNQVKEIFINNNYINIKHIDEKNYINTTYVYKNKTKNFIFYQCKNRKNCTGKGKIDIKKKEFIVTQECKEKKYHSEIDYDEFIALMKDKKYNLIDFTKRENQKYYVYYIIKENKNIDNPTIKNKFYNISNINLTLSLADLSKIRNKILDKYKNLDLDELVNKIDIENFDIFKKNFVISYEYKINNKIEYREQRIIIFGLKENIDLINEKNTNEFFFRFYI